MSMYLSISIYTHTHIYVTTVSWLQHLVGEDLRTLSQMIVYYIY